MLLSDLLRAPVRDKDGNDLGAVEDVLLVQDGPMLVPFGAAFRVEGLVIGRGVAIRLGYRRRGVNGPWLLRVIFRTLERRARYVPWDRVESWDGGVVQVAAGAEELGGPPE